jgi:hypothetical protein
LYFDFRCMCLGLGPATSHNSAGVCTIAHVRYMPRTALPIYNNRRFAEAVGDGFAGKHIDMQRFFLCNFLSIGSSLPFPTVSLVPDRHTNMKEI